MNKFLLILLSAIISIGITHKSYAAMPLEDCAVYYSDTNEPASGDIIKDKKSEKTGTSEAIDILHLVTTGDASIKKACQNGEITTIHRIEQKQFSIYIFYKKYTTIVYGE